MIESLTWPLMSEEKGDRISDVAFDVCEKSDRKIPDIFFDVCEKGDRISDVAFDVCENGDRVFDMFVDVCEKRGTESLMWPLMSVNRVTTENP